MKKVLSLTLVLLFLCSCKKPEIPQNSNEIQRGVWLSYYEIGTMINSKRGFESELDLLIDNCKNLKIQNLYIHVRSFCDAIYRSDYFPKSAVMKNSDFDILECVIKKCKQQKIKVHAWINPYRVAANGTNIDQLDKQSPAYKWLKDDTPKNDSNVCFANGIYLNPASAEVRALVIDGIRELIAKYEIDGIHFDDYFYPTTNSDFDMISYAEYKKKTGNPLSLDEWRRMNVNALISACFSAIKYADKDIVFSISPAASVEHNYNNLYADIKMWVKNGYVDEIIPQLYFGFEYPKEDYTFENLLNNWIEISKLNPKVNLKIGLACYKAKPTLEADKKEWQNNSDIIARQMKVCEGRTEVYGYVFFSYSSLFGDQKAYTSQREKIKDFLNNGG